MTRIELIPLAAAGLAATVAAATDLRRFKVYNALTAPTFALGLAASAWLGGWPGLASGLLGSALGFGLLVVFFAMGGVGAGDVKLFAALGAWLGPYLTYQVFVASAFAAGAYALVLVFLDRGGSLGVAAEVLALRRALAEPASLARVGSGIEAEVRRPDRRRRLVPFAATTCLGFFLTLAYWRADLDRVWPPYRPGGAASARDPGRSSGGASLAVESTGGPRR